LPKGFIALQNILVPDFKKPNTFTTNIEYMAKPKNQLRRQAYDARNAQPDQDSLSLIICNRCMAQPGYRQAETALWYIGCRPEVRTQAAIARELATAKCIAIPYCTKDQQRENKLGLWRLENFAELAPGTWGILEPPKHRWGEPGKEISPTQLDCILVPGVAFDRQGGRLGNGAGYYDRLLACVRSDTVLIGVCYESQLFERITMELHDVAMDYVITEKAVYTGTGCRIAN
jgi:5-formyltetrahydrofolate cyclo-ligase